MNGTRVFVGIGFGAIQSGLFLYEAWKSGRFGRLVVAEVMPGVVEALRRNNGFYTVNIAMTAGIEACEVSPVEILNPLDECDRQLLIEAVGHADEIATALPSVAYYGEGKRGDVLDILTAGFDLKRRDYSLPCAVIYTAENHNHAAEILTCGIESLMKASVKTCRVQVLNTVIGKMSGVVSDMACIRGQGLITMAPALPRAILVEAFNKILISGITLTDFARGIQVFEEKPDLLPFEEAKLYGHNATHALLGYLLREQGGQYISDAADDLQLLRFIKDAFIQEAGTALCRKYRDIDVLFTPKGFEAYVDDLITRMMNPHLRDSVDRVTRDIRRKLGWDDRLIGTMRLVLGQNLQPDRYARGAATALQCLAREEASTPSRLLRGLWAQEHHAQRMAVEKLIRSFW